MGLTIHYQFRFKGSKELLSAKLEQIRQKCLDLPFKEVGEVIDNSVTQKQIDVWNEYQWNRKYTTEQRDKALKEVGADVWTMIGAIRTKEVKKDGNITSYIDELMPCEYVRLNLWPDEGCESCNLSFYKRKREKYWKLRDFCKTQYAEHFVRSHLLVVKLLDLCKEVGFQVVSIYDEGEYYKTRDLSKLADSINEYTSLISSIFGTLKEQTKDKDIKIQAPIETSKNYINNNPDTEK